jgi:hypothetical protein
MNEAIWKFVSECAASKAGRFVFVAYLVYVVSMTSYAWDNFVVATYPFRFFGERELFELMNAPQIAFIRSTKFVWRWEASKFTDAIAAFYIALPWWIYGYVFELLIKRITGTQARDIRPDELYSLIEDPEERPRLVPGVLTQNWCLGNESRTGLRSTPELIERNYGL